MVLVAEFLVFRSAERIQMDRRRNTKVDNDKVFIMDSIETTVKMELSSGSPCRGQKCQSSILERWVSCVVRKVSKEESSFDKKWRTNFVSTQLADTKSKSLGHVPDKYLISDESSTKSQPEYPSV